jgi:hypothetical protein
MIRQRREKRKMKGASSSNQIRMRKQEKQSFQMKCALNKHMYLYSYIHELSHIWHLHCFEGKNLPKLDRREG